MDSIKKIYKIGFGPSSSHTMGPGYACENMLKKVKNEKLNVNNYVVTLYGSLALTGKGHMTDKVIKQILGPHTKIIFDFQTNYDYHPNGMKIEAFFNDTLVTDELVFSVGGGDLKKLGDERSSFEEEVYPHNSMEEILKYCQDNNLTLVDYIRKYEDDTLEEHLKNVYQTMKEAAHRGVCKDEVLEGGLNVQRKAKTFYDQYLETKKVDYLQYAYALAIAEENASGSLIVTAPTCGACGVVPSIILISDEAYNIEYPKLIEGLMVAGLIGNLCKTNASISGAEVGCQGEVGVACSMAAGMLAFVKGGTNEDIEYAAEIGLEHNLGMTCDPVNGLVQVPCIERNAIASFQAKSAADYALISGGEHFVSLDRVIEVMKETGKDLNSKYRETSKGGLAVDNN